MLGRIESPAFTISRNLRRAVLIRTFGGNSHGGLNERVPLGRAGRAGCAGWGDACGCGPPHRTASPVRSEEHTSELQSRLHLVCRLLLEKKKTSATSSPTP